MGRSACNSKVQRKRDSEKLGRLGLGKLGPHVGIVGPKSMLDSREIGGQRGGGVSGLIRRGNPVSILKALVIRKFTPDLDFMCLFVAAVGNHDLKMSKGAL